MNLRKHWPALWPHLIVIAAVLFITRQWWNPYLLAGHSGFMDLYRQVILHDAIKHGDWWPRFAEPFYFGHGSLLFNFYAPFSYYLSEIFMWLGFSVAPAIKLSWATGLLLSGMFMVLLARELFGSWAAAGAGALYVLAPYHLVDTLVRHAFGEGLAFTWLPLIFWGVLGAVRDRSAWRMTAGALGFALLMLTHNITAMISAPAIGFWWLFLVIKHRGEGWRGPILGAAAMAGGLLFSAFFWIPALMETDLIWSKESLIGEYFKYWNHFVYLPQFFSFKWGFGGSYPGVDRDGMSFQLGWAHWILLAGSIAAFSSRKEWRAHIAFFAALTLGSLMMCHFVSWPIWKLAKLLSFVQFPWRFLVLVTFAASVAAGATVEWLRHSDLKKWSYLLAFCALLLPFAFYGPYATSRHMLHNPEGRKMYPSFYAGEFEKQLKSNHFRRLELIATPEFIRTKHSITATARDDFLPKTVDRRKLPQEAPSEDVTVTNGLVLTVKKTAAVHYFAQIAMDQAGTAILHRFWYPGWTAYVDGKKQATAPQGEMGLVGVTLGEGPHEVRFTFESTPLRKYSGAISLGSGILLILFLGFELMRRKKT